MPVPNTNTFSLADVCNEIGLTGSNRTLANCFASAVSGGFDPAYQGSKDRLSNFRNYSHNTVTYNRIDLSTAIYNTSSLACSASNPPETIYYTTGAANTVPSVGDIIYDSPGGFRINGDNGYKKFNIVTGDFSSQSYAIRINTAGEVTQVVICTATSNTLTISPTSDFFPAFGGNGTINVTSNTSWSVTYPSWITGTNNGNGNGTISFEVDINNGDSTRFGTIQVRTTSGSPTLSRNFSASQEGSGLIAPD